MKKGSKKITDTKRPSVIVINSEEGSKIDKIAEINIIEKIIEYRSLTLIGRRIF